MKFQQFYELPDGEQPAAAVTVVVTQKGSVFLTRPNNIPPIDVIGILSAGIGIAINIQKQMDSEEESKIVKPPSNKIPPFVHKGNGKSH